VSEQPELAGIDWDKLPRQFGPVRQQAGAFKGEPRSTHFDQDALFHLSSRHTYNPEQQTQLDRANSQVDFVTKNHPLPEGITLNHLGYVSPRKPMDIPDRHQINITREDGIHVGTVHWNPRTGDIGGLYVDEGYRHLTNHLLQEAHRWADENGWDGPTQADSLTSFSERMLNSKLPAFKERDVRHVNGVYMDEQARQPLMGAAAKGFSEEASDLHERTRAAIQDAREDVNDKNVPDVLRAATYNASPEGLHRTLVAHGNALGNVSGYHESLQRSIKAIADGKQPMYSPRAYTHSMSNQIDDIALDHAKLHNNDRANKLMDLSDEWTRLNNKYGSMLNQYK
jgi:hypothetical protein